MQADKISDYVKASMDTLKMIDTFTASIKTIAKVSGTGDTLVKNIKSLYPSLNVVGSSGFAYAF